MDFEYYINNFEKVYDSLIKNGVSKEYVLSDLKSKMGLCLVGKFFTLENVQSFINHLDIILKFTDVDDMSWVKIGIINKHPDFISALARNIKYLSKPYDAIEFVLNVYKNMGNDDSIFTDEMIDSLVSMKVDSLSCSYDEIYNVMNDEQRILLFKSFVKYHIPIQGENFDISMGVKRLICDNPLLFVNLFLEIRSFYNIVKDDEVALSILDGYYKDNRVELIKTIINDEFFNVYDGEYLLEIIDVLNKVIVNENASFSDIKWIGSGSTSTVMEIGDKVVKIGGERGTPEIVDSPYIVRPVIRKKIGNDDNYLFLEVCEKTFVNVNLSDEDIYQLFSRLMDYGVIWDDPHAENVGFLLKPNNVYWNGKIDLSYDNLLLIQNGSFNVVLPKGEAVVIDLDYLYSYEEYKKGNLPYVQCKGMIARYEKEHGMSLSLKK